MVDNEIYVGGVIEMKKMSRCNGIFPVAFSVPIRPCLAVVTGYFQPEKSENFDNIVNGVCFERRKLFRCDGNGMSS